MVGDRLMLADGGSATVVSITFQRSGPGESFTTYNVEVGDWHTYFVAKAGVWVHNAGGTVCSRIAARFDRLLGKWMTEEEALRAAEALLDEAIAGGSIKQEDRAMHLQHMSNLIKDKFASGRGAWALVDDIERGKLLEPRMGKNTPYQFPYFDAWQPATGEAVSIKTTRLNRTLAAPEADLRGWVNEIATLPPKVQIKGYIEREGLRVELSSIKSRGLRVGIEPGAATPEHLELFKRIKKYGEQRGLRFVEFIEVK